MDDLGALHYQQQLEQQQQEEDYFTIRTNHPVYHEFEIKTQRCEDGDVLMETGIGGCRLWVVLTKEDAKTLAHQLKVLTK